MASRTYQIGKSRGSVDYQVRNKHGNKHQRIIEYILCKRSTKGIKFNFFGKIRPFIQ